MDAQVQARWVADLFSGLYPQTTSTLHNQDGYCCLGVAAEGALGLDGEKDWVTYEDEETGELVEQDEFVTYYADNGDPDVFNDEFCEGIGLNKSVHDFLTRLNDNFGWNFEEIAGFLDGRDLTLGIAQAEIDVIIAEHDAARA